MRRSSVVLVVLVALLAACGGGGNPEGFSRAAYVGAAMREFERDGAPITAKQVECFIGVVVDGIGVDRLNADGVTPRQFASARTPSTYIEDAEARKRVVAEVITGDCFGLDRLLVPALRQAFGAALPERDAACLAKRLVEDRTVRRAVANGILGIAGGPSLASAIQARTTDAVQACSINPLALLGGGDGG
ncbi:MAG: hypothetical protein RL531_1698 [Actinomycetota bacterium]